MISYDIPSNTKLSIAKKQVLISTPEGGRIALDRTLAKIWRQANGQELSQILSSFSANIHTSSPMICASLACLAEAGLLKRDIQSESLSNKSSKSMPKRSSSLISAVIVNYNSQNWLERCLPTLRNQSYKPIEIIVVDNASQDESVQWVMQKYPDITLIQLNNKGSLAHALNRGIEAAHGEFFLLLNPDTELTPEAVEHMHAVALREPECAAVAAKLKFTWAPAFMNGLENYVGAFSWGTDSGLGHLDLGQFDDWVEIPSACFAAALIPSAALKDIGAIDESFPLYYEDSEWCYRARLFGYTICAAPQAVVYHAFSGRVPTGEEITLSVDKLQQIVFGRLRFATKILNWDYLIRFLFNYFIEDVAEFSIALLRGRWSLLKAYIRAWNDYIKSINDLRLERKEIQNRRHCTDKELFRMQREIPAPLIRNGLPQLTWDIVRNQYLPLITSMQTHDIPEFSDFFVDQSSEAFHLSPQPVWRRCIQIFHSEGLTALLHRIGKSIQWRLMQP